MSLLIKKLFDAEGNPLFPSHSQKQSQRFRYYISSSLSTNPREESIAGIRIPAQEIELIVINYLKAWLINHTDLIEQLILEPSEIQAVILRAGELIKKLEGGLQDRYDLIQSLVIRADLNVEGIKLEIDPQVLTEKPSASISLNIQSEIKQCGRSMRLLVEVSNQSHRHTKDMKLIRGMIKSQEWFNLLINGKAKTIGEIAKQEGVVPSHVTRCIYRSFLAPDIIRAIMNGTQPAHINIDFIKRHSPLPLDWHEQRRLLGFEPLVPLN